MSVITFSRPKPRIVDNPKWTQKPSKTREINKRVDMLGSMNDRYKTLRGARDIRGLLNLAIEYDAIKCPNIANMIRLEAGGL